MTRTQAREQIIQFYNNRRADQEFHDAQLEPDTDDGFRLAPPAHCEQRTVWTVPEREPEPWVELVAWAVVLVGVMAAGAIAFGVGTWLLNAVFG